jgi:hypothetical protein
MSLAVVHQQREIPKNLPLLSPNGFRGGGGKLIAKVGLEERTKANSGRAQAVETLAKAHFVAHAANNEKRGLKIGREE